MSEMQHSDLCQILRIAIWPLVLVNPQLTLCHLTSFGILIIWLRRPPFRDFLRGNKLFRHNCSLGRLPQRYTWIVLSLFQQHALWRHSSLHFGNLHLLRVTAAHQPSWRLLGTPVLSLLLPHSSDRHWHSCSCRPGTRLVRMVHNWTDGGDITPFTRSLRYLITHIALNYGWSNLRYASFGQHHFLVSLLLQCRFLCGPECRRNYHTYHLLLLLLVERLIRISIGIGVDV